MNKWWRRGFVFSVVALSIGGTCAGADKVYQTGTLVDVNSQMYTRRVTAAGKTVVGHQNDLSVKLGNLTYVGECYGCKPGTWVIGDPIQVRIDKDKMFLRTPKGDEVKTRIVKQVRAE